MAFIGWIQIDIHVWGNRAAVYDDSISWRASFGASRLPRANEWGLTSWLQWALVLRIMLWDTKLGHDLLTPTLWIWIWIPHMRFWTVKFGKLTYYLSIDMFLRIRSYCSRTVACSRPTARVRACARTLLERERLKRRYLMKQGLPDDDENALSEELKILDCRLCLDRFLGKKQWAITFFEIFI